MRISVSREYQQHTKPAGFIPREFSSIDEFQEIVRFDHSPVIFKDNYRKGSNFISSDFLYADVDDGMSIDAFQELFKDYCFYISTSRNHQKEKRHDNGTVDPPCDRFHVLFLQAVPYTDPIELKADIDALLSQYPFFCSGTNCAARLFYGNKDAEVFQNVGTYFKPKRSQVILVDTGKAVTLREADEENAIEVTADVISESDEWLEDVGGVPVLEDVLANPEHLKELKGRLVEMASRGCFEDYAEWIAVGAAMYHSGKFTPSDYMDISKQEAKTLACEKWETFSASTVRNAGIGSLVYMVREKLDPEFFKASYFRKKANEAQENELREHVAAAEAGTYPDTAHAMPVSFWRSDHCRYKKNKDTKEWEFDSPLPTVENFSIMLSYYGLKIRENLMAHKITHLGCDEEEEGKTNNAFLEKLRSMCVVNGFPAGLEVIGSMVTAIGHSNMFHPVKEWIETAGEWDGVSRVKDVVSLFQYKEGFDPKLGSLLISKWLISCVAALYEKRFHTRGVLVLQGPQSVGKTSVLKSLFPAWAFMEGASLNVGAKDSIEQLISRWVCELAELEGVFKKTDISSLKAFLSSESDDIRFAYDKRSERIQRRSVFCGSVNDNTFLKDRTGNTRFWVIPVVSVQYEHGIDIRQLWLEIKKEYDNGATWWLNRDEEAVLENSNAAHIETDPMIEMVLNCYSTEDVPTRVLSTTEILEELGYRPGTITKKEANALSSALREIGIFQQRRKANKVRGWAMPNKKEYQDRAAASMRDNEVRDEIPF